MKLNQLILFKLKSEKPSAYDPTWRSLLLINSKINYQTSFRRKSSINIPRITFNYKELLISNIYIKRILKNKQFFKIAIKSNNL